MLSTHVEMPAYPTYVSKEDLGLKGKDAKKKIRCTIYTANC